MRDLTISLIQSDLVWEDIDTNIKNFDQKINTIKESDLIVLPEMFTTGFTRNAERCAESMDGKSVSWLRKKAGTTGAHILGSLIIRENEYFFNRLVWAKPDGGIETYDKKHLFRFAREHETYEPGKNHLTVNVHGWNIRTFICYDLRFPIWTRNIEKAYDVGVFIANWPERRIHHWKGLLLARAIENQCYVAGVNRIGKDGYDIVYSGGSSIVDPIGYVLYEKANEDDIHTTTLSYQTLSEYRKKFPVWMDADKDLIGRN